MRFYEGARWRYQVVLAGVCIFMAFAATAFAADAPADWFACTGATAPGANQAGAIDTKGDVDWYYFYTSAPGEVKVDLAKTLGDATLLALYRWDGGKLVEVGSLSTYSSGPLAQALPAGLYYAKLEGYSSSYVGAYNLKVTGTYATASVPAGVQAHPAPMTMTEDWSTGWWNAVGPNLPTRPYVGAVDTVGDVDWYYFYTSAPGEVKVGLNETYGDATLLTLYRWDGGKLVQVDTMSTYSSTPIAMSLPAGLYYAKLEGYSSSYVGGYDFTTSGTYAATVRPGAIKAHPIPVTVVEDWTTGWFRGQGLAIPDRPYVAKIDAVGDVDWYYFNNSAGGAVKVGLNETYGDATLLTLYRWDGGKLVQVDTMSTYSSTPIAMSLPAGLYYAKLEGYSSSYVGGYDFTVGGNRVTSAKPYISTVRGNGSTLQRNKVYSFYGYVRPVAPAKLLIQKYSSSKRKWVAYKTVSATTATSGIPRKIAARWRPSAKGSYRLIWSTTGSRGLGAGFSGYRTVRVK